jgi:hypothetical protein
LLQKTFPSGTTELLPIPTQRDETGSYSAATLAGSAALPFVISTGAQRSGEISVWMLFLGKALSQAVTMRKARAMLAAGLSPVKLWSLAEASALLTKWASAEDFVNRQV